MTLELTQSEYDSITNLSKSVKHINDTKQNYEFEMRFGEFVENKFKPGINQFVFEETIKFLNTFAKFEKIEYSNVSYYGNGLRKYEIINELFGTIIQDTFTIQKKLIKNIDIPEYNIRFSANTEMKVNDIFDGIISLYICRKRFTYTYNNCKFDVSMYFKNENKTQVFYDLEIELISGEDINCLLNLTYNCLRIIYQTKFVMKKSDVNGVRNLYASITKGKKFIGSQPETLSVDKFNNKDNYALTLKLNGMRMLLINYNNKVYSFSSKMDIKYTGIQTKSKTFLLDCEFFKNKYYVFDIIHCKNSDVSNHTFIDRNLFIKETIKDNPELQYKEYIVTENLYETFINTYKKYFSVNNEYLDGIILLSINKSYRDSIPLKWKPEIQNTIDFRIKKIDNCKWELYCGDFNNKEILFHNYPITTVTPEQDKFYPDNSIAEFRFSKMEEKFIVVKPRNDKSKPNFITIAKDNFKTVINPFQFDNFKNTNLPKKKVELFNARRFNNYIKSNLIKKYSKKAYTLLDLACGKGGDLYKWIDSNITYVKGYDNDLDSINEARSRYNNSIKDENMTKNYIFRFEQADLGDQVIKPKLKNLISETNGPDYLSDKFDIVSCFFAIHYFFKSEKTLMFLINNITNNIKEYGYFIMTTFSDTRLKELDYTVNTDSFKIKNINIDSNVNEIFENTISVWIKDSVLDKEREEYLVSFEFLIAKLNEYGIELVETGNFSDYYSDWKSKRNYLNETEKLLCFLNIYAVFVKKNKSKEINLSKYQNEITKVDSENPKILKFQDLDFDKVSISETKQHWYEITEETTEEITEEDIKKKKLKELKELCKINSLLMSGKKEILINRLIEHFKNK